MLKLTNMQHPLKALCFMCLLYTLSPTTAFGFKRLWVSPHGPIKVKTDIPFRYAIYKNTKLQFRSSEIPHEDFKKVLQDQYQIWSIAMNGELKTVFDSFNTTTVTKNRVDSGKEDGIDGIHTHQVIRKGWYDTFGLSKIAIAVTLIYSIDGYITDADVVYNNEHYQFCIKGSTCPIGHIHLGSVALHEIGHQLGFDHSDKSNSSMYAHIQSQEIKPISQDERDGITCNYTKHITPQTVYIRACLSAENEGPLAPSDTFLSSIEYTCGQIAPPGNSSRPWIFLALLLLMVMAFILRKCATHKRISKPMIG